MPPPILSAVIRICTASGLSFFFFKLVRFQAILIPESKTQTVESDQVRYVTIRTYRRVVWSYAVQVFESFLNEQQTQDVDGTQRSKGPRYGYTFLLIDLLARTARTFC